MCARINKNIKLSKSRSKNDDHVVLVDCRLPGRPLTIDQSTIVGAINENCVIELVFCARSFALQLIGLCVCVWYQTNAI